MGFFFAQINGESAAAWVLTHMDTLRTAKCLEPLLTPVDAGDFLGVHEKTVIKMARLRQLPALRLGKHWRFRRADLESWAANEVQSTGQPVE